MVHDSRFPRPSGVLGEKHALVVGGLPTFAPSRPAGRNRLDSLSFTRNNELFALLIRGFPSKLSVEKPQETRNPRNGRDFVHAALVACRSVPPRKCQRGRRRGRRGHHGDRGSKEQGAMTRGARAWHGRGSGILLHHETRIGHTGHPHAGARHAVHLPRARRRAGGGSASCPSWWAAPCWCRSGTGRRWVSWWRSKRWIPQFRKGRARTPRKRRTKRITASAPNTRMPARARAARVPASTWAGSSPSCARCPSRTSTRKAPHAPSGSRSATWRRSRRACACSRRRAACRAWCARSEGYWRLEEPAVGEVDDRWVVPGPAFGSLRAAQERRQAGVHRGGACARASCAWRS